VGGTEPERIPESGPFSLEKGRQRKPGAKNRPLLSCAEGKKNLTKGVLLLRVSVGGGSGRHTYE